MYYSSTHNPPNARTQTKKTHSSAPKRLAVLAVVSLVVFGGWKMLAANSAATQEKRDVLGTAQNTDKTGLNKAQYSTSEPSSIWLIVNKNHPLPTGYAPGNLVTPNIPLRFTNGDSEMSLEPRAAAALEQLVSAAKSSGFDLMLGSGYRSYEKQQLVYDQEVKELGETQANKESAKPGTSEHQTGLAVDIDRSDRKCEFQACFGNTDEGKWIAQNAPRFGYIVRYLKGKEAVTGYEYEPWHLRFVGTDLAKELQKNNQTMEEFFGIR
jgi:LAS superfamily LD-carboxypeptidase LdcB